MCIILVCVFRWQLIDNNEVRVVHGVLFLARMIVKRKLHNMDIGVKQSSRACSNASSLACSLDLR